MSCRLIPMNGRVVVRRDNSQDVTKGGILLPDVAQTKAKKGTVVTVGEPYYKSGFKDKLIPNLKAGDVVLFSEWGGDEIVQDGETLMLIREDDVLAVSREE